MSLFQDAFQSAFIQVLGEMNPSTTVAEILASFTPEEVSPEEVSPEEVSPEEVSPKEMSPEEVSPEEPEPSWSHTKPISLVVYKGDEPPLVLTGSHWNPLRQKLLEKMPTDGSTALKDLVGATDGDSSGMNGSQHWQFIQSKDMSIYNKSANATMEEIKSIMEQFNYGIVVVYKTPEGEVKTFERDFTR